MVTRFLMPSLGNFAGSERIKSRAAKKVFLEQGADKLATPRAPLTSFDLM